ncbi:peptidylprolyl isomerase [Paenibacillus sp. MBLB4367]|uniref:peptidylprolyl isomerase n=1 Tax=Paenibacillus sp. MBLB4367 TaxID=3384767 RepID=UPI003907FC43
MKQKIKYLAIGVIVGALLSTSIAVYGAAGNQIEVYFKELRFMFDGTEKKITEGTSFIYEGTTYVPIRFMSESIGKFVQYDDKHQTIWVGNRYNKAPQMSIDQKKTYRAVIETTKGAITIELFANKAPVTVNNFVFLAGEGFYDNVTFHRILQNFVIQTGDPTGTGSGGPGYQFADELKNGFKYEPGIVAMANAGPNTNGSQFFICTGAESDFLNGVPNYTIFGKVVEGMDVVQAIASSSVKANEQTGEKSSPTEEIKMKQVTIQVQ